MKNYGKKQTNNDILKKALDFSISYTNTAFDRSRAGYIKIDVISEFIRIMNKYGLKPSSELFEDLGFYKLIDCIEIFSYVESKSSEEVEAKILNEFTIYMSRVNKMAFEEKEDLIFVIRALRKVLEDTHLDVDYKTMSSNEIYEMFRNELKKQYTGERELLRMIS